MISFLGLYQLGVQFFLFGCNFSFCGFISSLCVLLSRPGYHSVLLIFRFFRNIGWVGVLRWFMQRYSFSGNWFRYLVPLVYGDTQWTLFPVQFWVCRRVRDDCGSRFQPKWTEVLHSKLKMEFVLTLILDSTCLSRWSDILFEPNERVENRWRANPYNHMILHWLRRESPVLWPFARYPDDTEIRWIQTNSLVQCINWTICISPRTTPAGLDQIYHTNPQTSCM